MKNILVLFLLLSFQTLFAEHEKDKIYVEPASILVDSNGLYVKIEGSSVPVSAIYSDNDGIYILKPLKSWCESGHSTVCFFCEGCGVWYCPYRCGCPD